MAVMLLRKNVDRHWLHTNFPCMMACPAHTNAGRYVSLIAEGRFEEAYRVARDPNPLASVCGRVCAHPCEAACRRGEIDRPIAIRALKRFLTERYGPEAARPRVSRNGGDQIGLSRPVLGPKEKLPFRIAIVGAGPVGLAAAHDLALMGYSVTIFEAAHVAGGVLALGIPQYRLPRGVLESQIEEVLAAGDVNLKLNHAAGRDFTVGELRRQGFHAVLIATGAHHSRKLDIPGMDLEGVYAGLDFLRQLNLGQKVALGKKVVVIGGGNVAMDVARSAAREVVRRSWLLHPNLETSEDAVDLIAHEPFAVPLAALSLGAQEVHLVCLEGRGEMPAAEEEIEEAEAEGIILHAGFGPKRILGNGRVAALETVDTKWVFDHQGRFNPAFYENTEKQFDCDTVILAIGQAPKVDFLLPDDGVKMSHGLIAVNRETLMTTSPGVFAGGECVFGPRLVIDGVGDGKRAAISIDCYLRGRRHPEPQIEVEVLNGHRLFDRSLMLARQSVPTLPPERRAAANEVEIGYDEQAAIIEARRCLRCWVNTVFDGNQMPGSECVLCGGCVDVCPEDCLQLIPLDRLEFEPGTLETIRRNSELFAVELNDVAAHELGTVGGAVMLKDEKRCIRCGLCAVRCPVNTITMEAYRLVPAADNGLIPVASFDFAAQE